MRLFTSDTHYGHQNIIRFCDRPYEQRAYRRCPPTPRRCRPAPPDPASCCPGEVQSHGQITVKRSRGRSPVRGDRPLTCAYVVAGAVFWFRTSWTDVSRHAGLMSPEIPDAE
jgi:hypothetical protein